MNQTAEFLIWLIAKSNDLGIQQKFTTFDFDPPVNHYTVKSFNYEPVVSGHACSHDVSEAKLKACVEFIERLNLRLSYPSNLSVGFACHFDEELAKKNAYAELLERDSFLWHWHHVVAPIFVKEKITSEGTARFYELQSRDSSIKIRLCLFQNKNSPLLIGLGANEFEERALQKSLMEALAGYYNFKINNPNAMGLEEFQTFERNIPSHHFQLSLSNQYQTFIKSWINSATAQKIPTAFSVQLHKCDWHESLRGHSLKMYRAFSDQLLKFYFGQSPFRDVPNLLPHPVA